ncbi:hypothetical protein CN692_18720 [Bacillus sp. AFS002410]|uniref:DUF4030 domain-containing protein n=1 Tax=Bacillus sp. AFS002410 TaxID=2033481 RepID=UPI000BEFB998|nr:DUF4030 domain-containing protein [Bacillus sp. AFS002410]PEJ56174.1 hypothetical protein CN692_18720 [Bacillus sp. AFS002410]
MNDYLSNNLKIEMDKIKIPEDKLDQALEHAIKRGKKKHQSLGKKVVYLSSAVVLLVGLLIGSAFVSPAMARVVSKIPYLGQIFEFKNDVVTVISEELRAKGYNISGAGVSFPEKEINIGIKGSEKYFDTVKSDVEDIAKDILHSRNYDAYTVKVSKFKERKLEMSEEERNRLKKDAELMGAVDKLREKYHFEKLSLSSSRKIVDIDIPDNEKRTEEIKKEVKSILWTKTKEEFTVKLKKINMKKREQDRRWVEILSIVREDLLGKKDYKVRMVGYSVHPEPEIQMFITLPSSDENAKDFAQQLEKVIDDFLKSEQMKSRVKNDPYHITIYSKDDKIIN